MLVHVDFFRVRGDGFPHGIGCFGLSLRALGRGIFVFVRMLHLRLPAGLHGLGLSTLCGIFTVMLFLLNDYLIVGNVSWIGHR